jgi:tetratricopeptide (TPR) repeat protein
MYRAWKEALALEPNPRYNFKVADALLRRGAVDEAAKYAEAAARQVPRYAGLVAYLGVEEGKKGNWRRGRELLQIASECNPADTLWKNLVKNMDAALADTTVKPPHR